MEGFKVIEALIEQLDSSCGYGFEGGCVFCRGVLEVLIAGQGGRIGLFFSEF